MKIIHVTKILALPFIVGLTASVANAQIYSGNIVGYYNLPLYAGNNYIADQFHSSPDNTLNSILSSSTGGISEGATFTEWNPTTGWLPTSTYDTVAGWSINYTLSVGEGGLLNTTTPFNNTFTGTVDSSYNATTQIFTPPLVTATGDLFLSCVIPIVATFDDVVGRDPRNGESVTMLNAQTQVYTTTTFESGTWNNGAPSLNVGESAFFNLVPVPEPSVLALSAAGLLGIVWRRKRA